MVRVSLFVIRIRTKHLHSPGQWISIPMLLQLYALPGPGPSALCPSRPNHLHCLPALKSQTHPPPEPSTSRSMHLQILTPPDLCTFRPMHLQNQAAPDPCTSRPMHLQIHAPPDPCISRTQHLQTKAPSDHWTSRPMHLQTHALSKLAFFNF